MNNSPTRTGVSERRGSLVEPKTRTVPRSAYSPLAGTHEPAGRAARIAARPNNVGMSKMSATTPPETSPIDRAIFAVVTGTATHVLEGECVNVRPAQRGKS